MRSPAVLGSLVGVVGLAVSVVGTLRRGDPHLVSTAPDLTSLGLIALAMFVAMRALAGNAVLHARPAALRLTAVAGIVHGLGLAAFTVWYLPPHPIGPGAFAAVTAAAQMALFGWSTARLAVPAAASPEAPSA